MASSKTKSNGASILTTNLQRSISPHRFCSSTLCSSSSSKASAPSMSSFSSPMTISLHRKHVSSSSSVRFSIDQQKSSHGRSVTSSSGNEKSPNRNRGSGQKKTCMCSPTTHAGSFRCSLHRNMRNTSDNGSNRSKSTATYHSNRLYARRSAMANSLVRIGTVEGELVKRALASLIRPSSHQQRRRGDFKPRPSRLSVMSGADD